MKYSETRTIQLTNHIEYRTFPEGCTFIAIENMLWGGYDVASYETTVETYLALTGKAIGSVTVLCSGRVHHDFLGIAPVQSNKGD